MFGPEYARACGIEALEPLGIYLPGDKNYPGVLWDCYDNRSLCKTQISRR